MLSTDLELQCSDLLALDGRSSVQGLFTRLGYPVQAARATDATAEGMAERLTSGIGHIEVVAEDDTSDLIVYLVELRSVTQERINDLSRHFRDRPIDTLLVLTSDYEQIDFVLLDVQLPGADRPRRSASVVPRRITVRRREDEEGQRVALRALRRFSWTEEDELAQWEKLRSAFSIAEWSERHFDNRGLFSDHYLLRRLPERPEWLRLTKDRGAFQAIRELVLPARRKLRQASEQDTREQLTVKLLEQLGFAPVERKGPESPDHETPDYALRDPETGETLAVALTYKWNRLLDGPSGDPKDPSSAENPGAAVISLLDGDSNEWAVVTNGKHWRLYTANTSSRATNFLQIDLEEAAADSDPTPLQYFRCLFHADALRKPAADGACLLDELLAGSREYAKQVGDRLKDRVFADIFPILAEGFVEDGRARWDEPSDDDLRLVFDATLTLLYRLLFLLYAESRDLLPVEEAGGYRERSLAAIKREVGEGGGGVEGERDSRLAERYDTDSFELYRRLSALFRAIDQGDAKLNVPPYNGGLFATDPAQLSEGRERRVSAFLAERRVSDLYLARALDRLARDPDDRTHALVFIDYKSLGVRQLGSIYEGLLEFQVRVAPETMAVCTRKGAEVVLPLAEAREAKGVTIKRKGRGTSAPEDLLEAGIVYLANSRLERKASGSYYTPEEIVEYIVEHTVGPVLEEKLEGLRADLDSACREWHRRGRRAAAAELEAAERRLVEGLFDFRVLDPAMGSGHFLVTAVDFIADRLIDFLNGFPGNPVDRLLEMTRTAILESAAEGGVVIDRDKLVDVNLLKRHVLKRCIFGVDLNPMAVELAKVSLWLHCFTLGAPLSFLGHHLKTGNSLVGEMDPSAGIAPGSPKWGQFELALGSYFQVSARADTTSGEVRASREDFGTAERILEEFRGRCNLETAKYFEDWDARMLGLARSFAHGRSVEGARPIWERAQEMAEEQRFFHWPLEFPEAWYEPKTSARQTYRLKGEPGFHAVVGNPPWERTKLQEAEFFSGRAPEVVAAPSSKARADAIQALEASRPSLWAEYRAEQETVRALSAYLKACGRYPGVTSGDTNLYQLFIVHSWDITCAKGRFGLLSPSGIATDYGTRTFFGQLVEHKTVSQVLDFENRKKLFPDVDSRFKFCIFIGSGSSAATGRIRCGFFLHTVEEASAPERVIYLEQDDLARLNPNTLTLPVLRRQRDADIIARVYRHLPILERDAADGAQAPWGVDFVRMFDMTNDSAAFRELHQIDAKGRQDPTRGTIECGGKRYLRLYEGKMIHQYDHRFASVVGTVSSDVPIGESEDSTPEQHADPSYLNPGRFWVAECDVETQIGSKDKVKARGGYTKPYFIAFRDIARATDERTFIGCVGPRVAYGNKAPVLVAGPVTEACVVLAWINSLANDYVLRNKISSTSINWFYVKQQPIPTREQIEAFSAGGDTLAWIGERVLELSYTAWDLEGFARDMGYEGDPFPWDEERRLHLRCQLDALFFHVYGLGEDDIDYILETFWIVRRNDEKSYGTYRTKDLILAYYRAYERGEWDEWIE